LGEVAKQTEGAFTLVELIVVISILVILWTIWFIALQWYSTNARDVKRISDVKSLYSKVSYEVTLWTDIQKLMIWATQTGITINWRPATSNIWIINFDNLREKQSNFQDPTTKEDYKFAYSTWVVTKDNWEKERYEFVEFATISEAGNTSVIIWNYYQYKPKDSPSLFKIWSWIYLVDWENKDWILIGVEEIPQQPLQTYSWLQTENWSSCSVECWWWTQTWTIVCKNDLDWWQVDDNLCNLGSKPSPLTQNCNTEACVTNPPISGVQCNGKYRINMRPNVYEWWRIWTSVCWGSDCYNGTTLDVNIANNISNHPAFQACVNLWDWWRLPTRRELEDLLFYGVWCDYSNFDFDTVYWSSTEIDNNYAEAIYMLDVEAISFFKDTGLRVICIHD
jgi:type II secretory pathway pseudopilin PulG